ncbi:MAG: division plane positioning ATPase MipZ [Xanthobacteraceae bacterium]|jgi:chromosome partitioning protein
MARDFPENQSSAPGWMELCLVSTASPHVIVVGNHKGGSGKSTVAMHIIVALLKCGRQVASFDLDVRQRSLTRYIDNRREWAQQNGQSLELPEHRSLSAPALFGAQTDRTGDRIGFCAALGAVQHGFDYVVIDTPGGADHLSLLAHGMADTLVTPINDSFVDLDVIAAVSAVGDAPCEPSWYAGNVAAAMASRSRVCGRSTDWIVMRNRQLRSGPHHRQPVAEVLEMLAPRLGFRIAAGLSERVVYREFFPFGLTALDPLEGRLLGVSPSLSHVMARIEVRQLVEALVLPVGRAEPPGGVEPETGTTRDLQPTAPEPAPGPASMAAAGRS